MTTSIPRQSFDISNLYEVIQTLRKHHYSQYSVAKLYDLGLSLGLLAPTLENIKAANATNADGFLRECLSAWLRQVDDVKNKGGPTCERLIAALKSIGEIAVANAIDREKHPACMILDDHHSTLLQIVRDPISVADILHKELVLLEEALTAVKSARGSSLRNKALLKAVQEAVCSNHQNLETFANLLRQEDLAAVPVADTILKEYELYFTDNSEVQLVSDEGNCFSEESSGSPNGKEVSNQIFVPRCWRREFNEMRMEFGHMFSNVRSVIRQQSPPIHIDELKEYLEDCFPHLSTRLVHARSLSDILKIVREMCTLIDISILEGIVSQLKTKEAEKHIQKYKESIATFCGKVKVLLCVKEVFHVVKSPSRLRRETATVLLGWNAEDYILDDVRDFIDEGLGGEISIASIETTKSIEITGFFPVSSTAMLIARAHANLAILKEKGLLQLTIGYYTVYSSKDEVVRLDKERTQLQYVKNDQDSLRLQVQEKEETNQQLPEEMQEIQSAERLTEQQKPTNEQHKESLSKERITGQHLREKQGIKLITVGYCPMWNKEMCDEMYSAMDSKIKELSQKVKSCEDEIISLKKTLKDKNEESAHLEEKVERLEKENDLLTKNLAVMETTICDERSDHEKEKSDMELQLRKVKEELENLKQLLKKGEEEKKALRMTETELREQMKTKSEMNRKMTQEIQQLKFSFSQMKRELEASLLTMKSEIESLQETLQSLKGKDQQQVLEIEQLQSSLQAKEDMTLSMEKSLQFLTEQVYVLKMEQEHAIEESVLMKENLQAELQEKDEALSLKQHQLHSFRVAKLELEKNLQQTKVEIDQLQRKITSLSMQLVHREQLVEKMVENGNYLEISGQQSPSTTEKVSVSTSTDDATDDSTLQEEIELTETSASFHSSSADKCQEVVIVESVIYVSLHNLFSDCAAILLNKLTITGVRELRIRDTPLSQESIQLLLSLLPQLRLLHFNNASLPETGQLVHLIMAITENTSLTNLSIQFSSPLLTFVTSTSGRRRAESLSHLLQRNSTLTHLALSGLSLDEQGIHMLLAALANNATVDLLILDDRHRGACNEYDAYYSVKHRVDFR